MSDPKYIAVDHATVVAQIRALFTAYPELLGDDDELLAGMIEGETDFRAIMSRILDQRLEADSMAAAIKERESALKARRERIERKSDAMTALMRSLMAEAKQEKLTLPEATLSITKPRSSVNVLDVEELPQGMFKTVRQADKKAIAASIEAGEPVPGATITWGEPGLTVRKT